MLASLSNSGRMTGRLSLVVLLTAIGAAGCADPEIDRAGTWKPTGVNDQNLDAMLVNPQDRFGGTAATTTRGDSASRAVTRLLLDRRRPLLDTALSRIAPSSSASGDGGAIQTPGSSSTGGSTP